MTTPVYPPLPYTGDTSSGWTRRIVHTINNMLAGRLNVVLPVTLTANSTTTRIIDERISYYSALLFSPTTADAAAIMGSLHVSSQKSGSATLTHALTAGESDCTFNTAIFG